MLRKPAFLLACFLLSFSYAIAQPLTTFTNIQNQMMVWDNGMIRKIDYLQPIQTKVGRVAIPYIDNSRSFKIYYGGGVKTINIGFTNSFLVSDDLVTFMNANSLNVFDRGTVKNLSGMCQQFYMGDSLVLFFDGIRSEYKAYYNGSIYPIENFLAGAPIDVIKVSDNIAAYINYANQFHLFYHGNIIQQDEYQVNSFDVGRNTVAYVDINNQFRIFHDGKTRKVDDFKPASYVAGDNLVAFVGSDNHFKIFYNDSVYNIGFFTPTYQVGDNIVAYEDPSGYFKVFYKGDIITLESYYPDNFKIKYNSLAYVNRTNTLRMFSEGEIYDVTTADLVNWDLFYDVVQYQIGQNIFRIFYKGTEYE